MSENCRVYWLYLITTYKYKSNKIWSLKHTFDKKKNGACVFWAPVFFLSFLAGKLKTFWGMSPEFLNEKKNGGQLLSKSCLEFETPDANKQKRCFRSIRKLNLPKIKWSILTQLSSVKIYFLPLQWTCLWAAGPLSWSIGNWLWLQLSAIQQAARAQKQKN